MCDFHVKSQEKFSPGKTFCSIFLIFISETHHGIGYKMCEYEDTLNGRIFCYGQRKLWRCSKIPLFSVKKEHFQRKVNGFLVHSKKSCRLRYLHIHISYSQYHDASLTWKWGKLNRTFFQEKTFFWDLTWKSHILGVITPSNYPMEVKIHDEILFLINPYLCCSHVPSIKKI